MTNATFCKYWLAHFAKDIPKTDIKNYVTATGNYIWHIFSWKLLDDACYLTGNAAKAAYDKVDKADAVYVDQFHGSTVKVLEPRLHTAAALDAITEVYVAPRDFSWTYIKTHEDSCGPYFMKRL